MLGALRESEDALTAFLRNREQVGMLRGSVTAAEHAVRVANLQYDSGVVGYQRVLDSQATLATQQDRHTAARGSVVLAVIGLYKALGGGWQPDDDPAAALPEAVVDRMRERTDWGGLLGTDRVP